MPTDNVHEVLYIVITLFAHAVLAFFFFCLFQPVLNQTPDEEFKAGNGTEGGGGENGKKKSVSLNSGICNRSSIVPIYQSI